MPRPNALLESLGEVRPPYLHQRYDPYVAPNYDPDVECPHKPWQTYTKYPCSCGRELWPPRGRGRGESLYSPRRLKAKMRAIEAMRLKAQGWTYRAIAEKLGYATRQGAHRAVQRTIDEVSAQRNWEEQSRLYGGRPRRHYTEADYAALLASFEADRQMNERRLETAQEQLAAIVASQAKRAKRKD